MQEVNDDDEYIPSNRVESRVVLLYLVQKFIYFISLVFRTSSINTGSSRI